MKIVSTQNVHKDEQKELDDYLNDNHWLSSEITADEAKGLKQIINHVINSRQGDEISDLSYLELIKLKSKINNL